MVVAAELCLGLQQNLGNAALARLLRPGGTSRLHRRASRPALQRQLIIKNEPARQPFAVILNDVLSKGGYAVTIAATGAVSIGPKLASAQAAPVIDRLVAELTQVIDAPQPVEIQVVGDESGSGSARSRQVRSTS